MADELKILYEDNHLLAVYKPAGVLVQPVRSLARASRSVGPYGRATSNGLQPDTKGGESLMEEAKQYLKKKYNKPGNVFLGLVHRLDRPVSGIVLFAKTSKGASRISEQFREHRIKKTYTAVVFGKLEPSKGVLRHSLMKDEGKKLAIISEEGKESELYYETVRSNDKFSLVKVWPTTGRFHQIRAQFAQAGHPIVGDRKYGAPKALEDGSIALCATELEFETATTDEIKKITADYPKSWEELI